MTPEERAYQIHLFGGKADNADVRAAITSAIREAVLAERAACAALVRAVEPIREWEALEFAARAIEARPIP